MISIFDYGDYKLYLKAIEAERASFQRGFRSRLAEALNCQNAYVSQVFHTKSDFSPEQAANIAEFLRLGELENRYFVLLVLHARAGTPQLREFFKRDIDLIKMNNLNISGRVPAGKDLSSDDQNTYYSNWLYPTIHILVTIPKYRTVYKIGAALGIDENVINEIILFLISSGLITEKNGVLLPGLTQLHLKKESSQIRQHHTNWRLSAIHSLAAMKKTDIHYSTISSLSYEDAEKLQLKFVQMIQEYVETITPSKEETLYNFNLDFYRLTKQ